MARIAIDCDGVLADFDRAYKRLIGVHEDFVPTSWRKIPNKHWRLIDGTWNFWMTVPALKVPVRELATWMASTVGHEIWFLTARGDTVGMSATKQTKLWLDSCGIVDGLHVTGVITVPHAYDKVNLCSKLDIDWVIDDKLETIEEMDRFPYLHAALMDQPWNQGATPKWRVKSMSQFLEKIK